MILTYSDKSIRTLQIVKVFSSLFFLLFITIISPWLFTLAILTPLFLFYKIGIEIDTSNQKYRRYEQLLRKKGIWKDLNNYNSVVVKPHRGQRKIYHVYSGATRPYLLSSYEIYLTNETQGKKLFINSFKDKTYALKYAEDLALKINFKVEKYKPVKRFHNRNGYSNPLKSKHLKINK